MPNYKLTYFDIQGRAEPIRLAFHLAGIPFTDERLSRDEFVQKKETFPFGQLPVLDIDGFALAQQHAILRYVGTLGGLYPKDPLQAAKVDMFLSGVEDLTIAISGSLKEQDETRRKSLRKELASTTIPKLFKYFEKLIAANGTGYFVGNSLTIADLMLYCSLNWLKLGVLDGIPKEIADPYDEIGRVYDNVNSNAKVTEWNKAHAKK